MKTNEAISQSRYDSWLEPIIDSKSEDRGYIPPDIFSRNGFSSDSDEFESIIGGVNGLQSSHSGFNILNTVSDEDINQDDNTSKEDEEFENNKNSAWRKWLKFDYTEKRDYDFVFAYLNKHFVFGRGEVKRKLENLPKDRQEKIVKIFCLVNNTKQKGQQLTISYIEKKYKLSFKISRDILETMRESRLFIYKGGNMQEHIGDNFIVLFSKMNQFKSEYERIKLTEMLINSNNKRINEKKNVRYITEQEKYEASMKRLENKLKEKHKDLYFNGKSFAKCKKLVKFLSKIHFDNENNKTFMIITNNTDYYELSKPKIVEYTKFLIDNNVLKHVGHHGKFKCYSFAYDLNNFTSLEEIDELLN